jgi:hypothetical protein
LRNKKGRWDLSSQLPRHCIVGSGFFGKIYMDEERVSTAEVVKNDIFLPNLCGRR